MPTPAQTHANQQNSQKSTGPTSQTGQQASSQNAIKHGLASHTLFYIMPDEDGPKFSQLVERLRAEHQPQTQTENDLVVRMAQHEWLRARALRFQSHCLEPDQHVSSTEYFSLYLRYQTTNERAYSRCLQDLLTLRAERRKVEIGFVSQKRAAESQDLKKEAQNLKQQQFELKKQEFEWKKHRVTTASSLNIPVPHPETSPVDLEMAA